MLCSQYDARAADLYASATYRPGMTAWAWSNPRWRDEVGDDVVRSVREAVRRGVDLRDTLAEGGREETGRALFLVDVLNHVAALLGVDTDHLWEPM